VVEEKDIDASPQRNPLQGDGPLLLTEEEYVNYTLRPEEMASTSAQPSQTVHPEGVEASTEAQPPPHDTKSVSIEEERDADAHVPGSGLPRVFPVIMEDNDMLEIEDVERIVDEAPTILNSGKSKYRTLKDLHEIEEIVQEFTRTRFPSREHREQLRRTVPVIPEEDDPFTDEYVSAAFRAVVADHEQKVKAMGPLTEADIPRLRAQWVASCQDIMNGVPEELPPVRGVNHRINLIDDTKQYNYHMPRCPDALKTQLLEKIARYTRAGWWESVQTNQGAPMLCIPKKDG
jgi:hypothetical protein